MYTMKTICVLMFIMLLSTIQAQNGEFDSWPGNVSVLLDQPLTLTWTHSLSDPDIEWCYFQFRSPKTSPDEFLGWDNNLKKRLNISDNQLGWRFINMQYPCQGGIERDRAESQHAGNYRFYVITTQGEEYVNNRAHITVVEGAGLRYSLTVGETEHKFVLSELDKELDPIEVTEDDTLALKLKLLEGFAPSNLSILKQDKGWEPASVTCSQKQECQAPFSANKDTVKITASIETSVQGISQIRINQPISYNMKEHSIVGLVVVVVFLVLFLLLLIILFICLCNKKARHLKKVRKYLLRKHDDSALKEQLKNLTESLNQARKDVKDLTEEKNSLHMSNNSLRDNNMKLEEKVENLEKDNENLLESLQKKTLQCNDFAQKNSDLQEQLSEKERELTRTKQEAQTNQDLMRKQHEDEVNKLNVRITELERHSKKPGAAVRQESGATEGELEFIDTFNDQLLAPGEKLFLSVTCSHTARMVSWFRGNTRLLDGVGNGIKLSKEDNNTYSLRIKEGRVKPGMYVCQATDQRNTTIQHQGEVSIGEGGGTQEPVEVAKEPEEDGEPETSPPEFTDTSDLTDKYLAMYTPLKLSVAVSGSPLPTVTWYRGGKMLYPSPGQTAVEQRGGTCLLTINPRYTTVDGQYSCAAENAAGRVQSDIITVQSGTPKIPYFVSRLFKRDIEEGSSANFKAEVNGFPPPQLFWYHNGVQLSNDARMKISKRKTGHYFEAYLLIDQCSMEDDGEIKLVASNEKGSVNCVAQLKVKRYSSWR